MGMFTKVAALALPCIAAIAVATPAAAITVNVAPMGGGVYGADFSAAVPAGPSSVQFDLVFPVAGTGSVTFTSTLARFSGVQITGATLNGNPLTIATTPVGGSSFLYTGGDDITLGAAATLPLIISVAARTTGFVSGNVTFAAVPEPASWALMIGGLGLVGGVMRRRQSVRVSKVGFAAA